jgi:tetratricopeptide (TPR) repeat protein
MRRAIDNLAARAQSRRCRMNVVQNVVPVRVWVTLFCVAALLFPSLELLGQSDPPVPNSTPAKETPVTSDGTEALRVSLELQAQLHAAQEALKRNEVEQRELEKDMAARLLALEEAIQKQRSAELEAMQAKVDSLRKDLDSNGRTLLRFGAGIAVIGFFVLLATGYLQWRSVNRLAEFSALVQSVRALPAPAPAAAEAHLLGATTTAQANGKLFGALSDLEKRINELEHAAHPSPALAAAQKPGNGADVTNGHSETEPAAVWLAKGQALLNLDQPAEALACFEAILKAEPNHGEALVKRGLALEALDQTDEALRCYDRAIAANADLTIAYLQKGGLFNRLERYEEALQCYELALRAQEKAQHN